jgi:TonB-linked SusC/RagA family outer membrane protein
MKKIFTEKLWKLMKICAVQGMIAILFCGVAFAHKNYAQVLDREITLSVTEAPFDQALNEIAYLAQAKFAYSPELLNVHDKITFQAEHRTVREILNEILLPRKIQYSVQNDGITISLKKIFRAQNGTSDYHNVTEASQSVVDKARAAITGVVTDLSKQPLAGVNILIKGSTNGTTSDAQGYFSIQAEENDILIFSFIGYASQEIKVGSQTTLQISLTEDIKSLGEVVVNAGYWEVKEKEQTGNISRITSTEIQKQTVSNPLQALQGRMTGVYIQQNTGMPGGGFKIQVRGQNSLRNGSDGSVDGNLPLYLIDGVPFTSTSLTSPSISGSNLGGGNPLSTINPNDIESIEVLKDADATAIYGSRGANGVVLITTKRAKAGKVKVNLDVYQGIGQVSNFMSLLNTKQYLIMRKEAFQNDATEPTIERAPDLLLWDSTRQTNWQKKLIGGTANVTNAQFSLSGGSARTQFLFGGGYYRETTVFPGSNSFQRASGRLTVTHQSEDERLNVESSVSYSSSLSNIPSIDFTGQAITLSPNAPALYDENGRMNWENGTWVNPLASLENKYRSSIDNLVANSVISYKVIDGLNLKSSLGYTSMDVNELRTNPLSSYNPQDVAGRTGSSTFGDSNIKTWIIEPQADYTRKIGDGSLSVLIGSTFQQSIQTGSAVEGTGYTNDAFLENIAAATAIRVAENTHSQYRYAAAFSRINYNWKEKYIINLTGRRDGSSRFGPGNRFANFGAVGAAWIFTNETFIANAIPFLSFGKLRTSYGTTGSDAIGNYQFLETYSPTQYSYAGSNGLMLTRLSNPNYSWETNRKFEVGMELGLWKDLITFSTSFYLNQSSNQLVGLPLPVMTGNSSVQFNLPATVQNEGWEFQVSSMNIKNQKFQWSTTANITIPSNTLIEFPELEKFPAYVNRFDVGKSVYLYKAYQYNGVDPQTGLYTMRDLSDDGTISSPDDYVGIKKVSQIFYGGIGNSIKYSGIQLDFFFQFVKQSGYGYAQSFIVPGYLSNQPSIVMDRWRQPDDKSNVQRFSASDPTGEVTAAYYQNIQSDNLITDASFIRLKNVSLSWQLPNKWMRKVKMNESKIYIQGQNLLTFTNYKGLDPETQLSQTLPPLRMITAGIHISL